MGFNSTKLDRKGLSELFISLNESCDGLLHEYSLIMSESIRSALEKGTHRKYSDQNSEQTTHAHNVIVSQQGLLHIVWFYKDTRGASDLLKKFNGYTNAILSLGDTLLNDCHEDNFQRITNQYSTVQKLQRQGREYFKLLIEAERKEKEETKKAKQSVIPINLKKTA